MRFHPDVLAAHAQFGGDLEAMQLAYDLHATIEAQAALIKELVEALEGVLPLVKPKTDTDSERMAEARVALFHAAKAKAVQP
jgi:hypothetical protein